MRRSFLVALVATLVMLGACGDDDEPTATADESPESTTSTTGADGSGDGEQAAGADDFCTAYQELLAGDPTPDQIREVAAIAPDDAQQPLETIAAGFEDDPEGFFGTEEFSTAFATVGEVAADECADEVIDVTAVDYGYEGVPAEVSPGVLGVNLSNEGTEFHEMVFFRKNDDTAESFDEIFAMEDQDAAEALITEAGATFAPPGGSAAGLVDVSEPGEYVAVCFVPVGSTPDAAEESDGPPHFTQGMMATFTVG